jgi:DNA integrity scanning protein DisA with diadenylate cyclase activity
MGLPRQTVSLLQAAQQTAARLSADAVLLLTETDLDWDGVRALLDGFRLLVVAQNEELTKKLKMNPKLEVLEVDTGPTTTKERLGLALLDAVATEKLRSGDHVVVLYNGIEVEDAPDQIDSMSVIHLGEHLERLSAQELRRLDTQVPLETLKAVVDLATALGREGREGKPIGTLFVVGDSRKVLRMTYALGFDPVRGYSRRERNIRDYRVRESIKEIAKLDGAIIVHKDGTVEAAARYINVSADGITLRRGLGSRHWAAAAISKRTQAIAIAVSESTGTVRLFQHGDVLLHIEPFSRPMIWRPFQLEAADNGDGTAASAAPVLEAKEQ